jgi:hypothetical protein
MVTEKFPVAMLPAESFTCTPKVAVPATGVVPESTPPLDKLNPTAARLLAPDVTDHVYPVPVPAVAANVCE